MLFRALTYNVVSWTWIPYSALPLLEKREVSVRFLKGVAAFLSAWFFLVALGVGFYLFLSGGDAASGSIPPKAAAVRRVVKRPLHPLQPGSLSRGLKGIPWHPKGVDNYGSFDEKNRVLVSP